MSQQRKILFVIGVLALLIGIFAYSQRVPFAQTFLGANIMFGMPFDERDSTKIVFVALSAVGTFLAGLVIIIVAFLKSDKTYQ